MLVAYFLATAIVPNTVVLCSLLTTRNLGRGFKIVLDREGLWVSGMCRVCRELFVGLVGLWVLQGLSRVQGLNGWGLRVEDLAR